jgi:phenylacetate-CoA ligase
VTLPAAPPFDPWAAGLAWHQTWCAALDPGGLGRALREERLARLIDWAGRRSPLYARHWRGARRLDELPPVDKAALMAGFDDWATDRRITRAGVQAHLAQAQHVAEAWLGSYLVWTSSGTSGTPGLFVQDAASLAAYDALEAQRLRSGAAPLPLPDAWAAGRRLAYVAAIGAPYAGHVSLERLRRLVPPPWLPQVTQISVLRPLAEIARQLQALQPDWLVTYPSCAIALAQRQAAGELRLRLAELWLGGEQLTPAQARRLQAVFGCTVRNGYGASEAYSIAASCAHGQLHLNADWVILEPVDARGRPVAPGTLSDQVLLTNLANLAQPLLRYALGDRVRLRPEPCPCGSAWPVIEVQGRSGDALELPARGGGRVTLLPLMLETTLEEQAGVADFQLLVQPGGDIGLRLGAGLPAATARRAREALRHCLQVHGAAPVRVALRPEPPQREPGSGKLRHVLVAAPPARRRQQRSTAAPA